MKTNWQKVRLGDVITFQRGYDLPREKMINGPYPVIGSTGIIGFHNEFTTETPSISVGRSGNVGNPFMINQKT
jgi:type I restriction enzyme S subunit